MNAKSIFGIIVRTIGLISLLYCVHTIIFGMTMGLFGSTIRFTFLGLIWVGISFWMLSGAKALVDFAYKDEA